MIYWQIPTVLVIALGLLAGRAEPVTDACCRPAGPSCCAKSQTASECTQKSLYQVESAWTTHEGRQIKLSALRGKPQVIAMFFASCQFTCPITLNDLKRIEAGLPEKLRAEVGFTLVSFDSERDTPQVLDKVRQERGLAAPNWTLLRGKPDDTRELAALLGINYRKDANGQFAHSNLITILNAEGEIVFQQPGLNFPTDRMIEILKALSGD